MPKKGPKKDAKSLSMDEERSFKEEKSP